MIAEYVSLEDAVDAGIIVGILLIVAGLLEIFGLGTEAVNNGFILLIISFLLGILLEVE